MTETSTTEGVKANLQIVQQKCETAIGHVSEAEQRAQEALGLTMTMEKILENLGATAVEAATAAGNVQAGVYAAESERVPAMDLLTLVTRSSTPPYANQAIASLETAGKRDTTIITNNELDLAALGRPGHEGTIPGLIAELAAAVKAVSARLELERDAAKASGADFASAKQQAKNHEAAV